jgi:acyl dehydratase
MPTVTLDDFRMMTGKPLGTSPWVVVSQEMIDRFADATGDDQFIHIDAERAKSTPLGGTVAQGFLSLGLMPRLFDLADPPSPANVRLRLNYGGNRTRFLAPVKAGSRVRGHFRLLALDEKRSGQFQMTIEYILEIEAAEKPAVIAEWITQFFV